MARIAGVELPKNKRMDIALTYIYGIGRPSALKILAAAKVDPGRAVGVDPKAGWIYANETKKPLVIFSMTGVRKGEFPLPEVDPATITEYIVSPAGGALLIRTPTSVIHVKIDALGGA